MIKKLQERLQKALKKLGDTTSALTKSRKERDGAVARLHDLHDRFEHLADDRAAIQKKIKDRPNDPLRAQWEAQLVVIHDEQLRVQKLAASKDTERDKAIARIHQLVERQKFFVKRKTILRKKIKEAKRNQTHGQPKFEPWMANGYNYNVTQGVKDFIARGVVNYGLTTTSLKRTYVPAGGSTTSYHLYTPGKAGDIAGARMSGFQTSEYNRNRGNGNCLELFGPINNQWLKYGASTYGGEGTPLENLHDTHVHGAFN